MSDYSQPSCVSRRACLRRHALKAGPANGSVGHEPLGSRSRPMATEVEQQQPYPLVSRPAWNCC